MKKHLLTVIAWTLLLVALLIALAKAAPTGACGAGLAAQDLAGTCRAATPTPGALESIPMLRPPKPGGVRLVPPKPGGVVVTP